MPSQTFFNLPKEKQKLIYESAIKEFSRVSFDEASINQIIHNANISRGSFYMYFEDKEDLYDYLLSIHKKKFSEIEKQIFEENDGDLLKSYQALFLRFVKKINHNRRKKFFQNIVLNTNFKNVSVLSERNVAAEKKRMERLISYIDKEKLNITKEEELYDIVDLCNMCLIHSLIKIIKFNEDVESVYHKFEHQLLLLKKGLYKEESHD